MRRLLLTGSVIGLTSIILTGCGCSSEEPQEVELILPTKYTDQRNSQPTYSSQPLSTEQVQSSQNQNTTQTTNTTTATNTAAAATQQNAAKVAPSAAPQATANNQTVKTQPVSKPQKQEKNAMPQFKKGIVINVRSDDTLNMRSGAGTGFKVVEKLSPGAIISTTGEFTKPQGSKHRWAKIVSNTGKTGWVNTFFLKIEK